MSADLVTLPLLLVAAFAAGALNAIAGGGSFLTFPALVFAGLPPVTANATGTVALLPGYIAAALGFRKELRALPNLSIASIVLLSLAGGVVGAVLLLVTPNDTFSVIIPWLLLFATAAFAFGPKMRRTRHSASLLTTILSVMAVAIYGGYFNGGLGIMLLALFGLLGLADLNAANGLKNLVSVVLTVVSVVVYTWGDVISWPEALIMMLAAALGGYLGARAARRIPALYLRYGIVSIGLMMTGIFFVR